MHLELRKEAKYASYNSNHDEYKRIHIFGIKSSETEAGIKSLIYTWNKQGVSNITLNLEQG